MRQGAIIAVLLLAGSSMPVSASFQVQPLSVRAVSMGGASLAGDHETMSLFSNAAAIAGIKQTEISFRYATLFAGLPGVGLQTGSVALVVPVGPAAFGLGVDTFRASGLKQERTLALSLGTNLFDGRVQAGITGKQFHHSYLIGSNIRAKRDPIFAQGTSKSAFGMDLGLMANVYGPIKAGLTIKNLNEPDVGLMTEDRVKREIHFGMTFNIASMGLKAVGDLFLQNSRFQTDQSSLIPAFGIEKTVIENRVSFRLGANPLEFTGGLGLRMGRMGFNYAFVLNTNMIEDNVGTHQLGLTLRFGKSDRFNEYDFMGERSLRSSTPPPKKLK